MSFKLFGVEFEGNEPMEISNEKMDKVYKRMGEKFFEYWLLEGLEKKFIKLPFSIDNINDVYQWIKCFEGSTLSQFKNTEEFRKKMTESFK